MLYASDLFREEKSDFRGEKTRVTITHTDHCSLLYRVFRSRVLSSRKRRRVKGSVLEAFPRRKIEEFDIRCPSACSRPVAYEAVPYTVPCKYYFISFVRGIVAIRRSKESSFHCFVESIYVSR